MLLLPKNRKTAVSQLYLGYLELNKKTGDWTCTAPSFLQGSEARPHTTGLPLSAGNGTFHLVCRLSSAPANIVQQFHTEEGVEDGPKMRHYRVSKNTPIWCDALTSSKKVAEDRWVIPYEFVNHTAPGVEEQSTTISPMVVRPACVEEPQVSAEEPPGEHKGGRRRLG